MHTTTKLADALLGAGLDAMAAKAAQGYYHDFLSPLAAPAIELANDLKLAIAEGNMDAAQILDLHLQGVFDATTEEGDEWAASPEGVETFNSLTKGN